MSRFSTGMIAGGIITAVGISLLASDAKSRRRVVKDSKRAMRKAGDFIGGVTDMF